MFTKLLLTSSRLAKSCYIKILITRPQAFEDVHEKNDSFSKIRTYGKMASTNASASKGWRSSTPSPTPTNFTGIPSSSTTLT
jgi:hypothetical protein